MVVTLPEEETKLRNKLDYMPMYKIIMWNDNITTMEFVMQILTDVFGKSSEDAHTLMMDIHTEGSSIIDVMPLERAEMKVETVHQRANMNNHPLKCTLEKN